MTATSIQSMIETLTEWFASHSMPILKLKVEGDERLVAASGKYTANAAVFDAEFDGAEIALDYMFELERRDERFRFTELKFLSQTEFEIKRKPN